MKICNFLKMFLSYVIKIEYILLYSFFSADFYILKLFKYIHSEDIELKMYSKIYN